VAAASFAEDIGKVSPDDEPDPWRWALTGGFDYATAYVHRGYVHQEDGFILQPFVTAAGNWSGPDGCTVTPYLTAFNSIQTIEPNTPASPTSTPITPVEVCAVLHHHSSATATAPARTGIGADEYQAEFMAGVLTDWRGLRLDVNYNLYAYPTGFFLPVQEIGGKVSYDLAMLWREPQERSPWIVRPYVGLYRETVNRYDRQATYLEMGIEPAVRFPVWGCPMGVSLPLTLGMSPYDYYVDARGSNEFFGYWSLGAIASVPLPARAHCGSWYVTASVRYYGLVAESLRVIAGNPDIVVGKVGLGFAF
jgi:hypothetical protein